MFSVSKKTTGSTLNNVQLPKNSSQSIEKLATVRRAQGKDKTIGSRGAGKQSIEFSSPPILKDPDVQLEMLFPNIYDATPDHSILKQGFAKSLSTFHLEDIKQNNENHYKPNNENHFKQNTRKPKTSSHFARRKKSGSDVKEDPHQSMPLLTARSSSLIEISRKLAETTNFMEEDSDSFSECSETESRQNIGTNLVGFEKTKDFGDFVIFTDSPVQL